MRDLPRALLLLALLLAACSGSSTNDDGQLPTVAGTASGPALQVITPPPSLASPAPGTGTPSATAPAEATAAPPATVAANRTPEPEPTAQPPAATPIAFAGGGREGALIRVSMESQVGLLLDDFPAEMRDRVAAAVLQQPEAEWLARAERQVRYTRLRLNYRDLFRPGKGQLPLPPADQWTLALFPGGPLRAEAGGRDLVLAGYTMTATILTDAASAAAAEPALAEVGGVWEEPFTLPPDPDLLYQRTGRACINDNGFPPNSVDSENAWYFYDFWRTTCRDMLALYVGAADTVLRFERLPWDEALADSVRLGPLTSLDQPELGVVAAGLEENRIVYRYFAPGDCALEEGAVNGAGWRRLLQFEATVHNTGGAPLDIGQGMEAWANNLLKYAPCHAHTHFRFFGDFFLLNVDERTTSKQAFCMLSSSRYSNNELSPLTHSYSCRVQGIQVGWVDEYMAGLDTQWIDITDLQIPPQGESVDLGFTFNPHRMICEGELVRGEDGRPVWEATDLTAEDGQPVNRPRCNFLPGWEANNEAVIPVFLPPTGSFVTLPCASGEAGPLRNCGFSELLLEDEAPLCRPGEPVELALRAPEAAAPQVVRACEWSDALGTGVACTYEDALANAVVGEQGGTVSFACPAVRDRESGDGAPAGGYALYSAPAWPGDDAAGLLLGE
jgi:hypothetical protein